MNLSSKDIYIHLKNSTFRTLPFDQGAEDRQYLAQQSIFVIPENCVGTRSQHWIRWFSSLSLDKGPEKPALRLHTDW